MQREHEESNGSSCGSKNVGELMQIDELKELNQKCARLNQENIRLTNEKAALEERCNELKNDSEAARKRIEEIESSRSWRLFVLLRGAKRRVKRLVGRTARKIYHLPGKLRSGMTALQKKFQALHWPPQVEPIVDGQEACTVQARCRRVGIYAFYDKDGIIDDYVLYYLKALSPWVERLLVVCNGELRPEGEAALRALGCEILVRENQGFDAWGVKAAVEKIGLEALSQYDEAVISNNTFFGPVCEFRDIFSAMANRKVDFWGISSRVKSGCQNSADDSVDGTELEYIQSDFYCVRKRMLKSEAFRRFWMELPELPDNEAAANLYEAVMTRYFSDAGYRWDCLMDRAAYDGMTDNPLIAMPMESIRDWGCPFCKRRAFFQDYLYLTDETGHQSASVLLRYLREQTTYPTELVWKNLIRTCHMCDLARNLHLSKTFDKNDDYVSAAVPMPRAALFMHIYDHTMAPELAAYAANLPPEVDIYISTVSQEKKDAILEAFQDLPNSLEIRVLPNRGRDVSALLTSFRDVVMDYDVACVTHDKKTEFLKPKTVGEGFAYMGYENILGSRALVTRILGEFSRDSFLGLLCSPDPSHADFASHIGLEWLGNYENTKTLAGELGLHIPMDEEHPPVAPYGSSFWFRTAALEPLFQKKWTYDDFPEEPLQEKDGTIMHAIERIYPYAAQHTGYYSAVVMTTDYAALEIGNLAYYARQYAHVMYQLGMKPCFNFAMVKRTYETCLGNGLPPAEEIANQEEGGVAQKLRRKLMNWAEL